MSRPRPPLHDPYGLLRQPPPEAPVSIYGATPNALASTTSLPLSTSSPNRRSRQRGISPSRVQHGEEYDDQPYLTNVVRHHGQVTLVPPVNQGRTRKVKKRRNPDASTSAISLADTLAGPSSSGGPSRVSAGTRSRSPRRPRQGSGARATSSPDIRASPYPDYPPPSFEEVLALDRNNASPSTVPTGESTRGGDVPSSMFLVSAPPSLSDPAHNHIATTTNWERDRLMGLSLEERVRREYQRNLRQPAGSDSPLGTDSAILLPRSPSPAPAPNSPTATSVTGSNFLTPQNLTPSPSVAALPLSTTNSPKTGETPQSPNLPPVPSKSPELVDTPTRTKEHILDHNAELVRNAPAESQVPRLAELDDLGINDLNQITSSEPVNSGQTPAQRASPDSEVPLASLLFTTRLRLDNSPERNPVREPRRDLSPVRGNGSIIEPGASEAVATGSSENVARRSPFARVYPAYQVVPVGESTSSPSRITSPIRDSSPIRSPAARPSSPQPLSPRVPSVADSSNVPARETPEPSRSSSSTTVPRRPPPPPPRPRQRQVGSGVAARISVYEALLANAPKVPPPIPPRPRPRSQSNLGDTPEAQSQAVSVGAIGSNPQVQGAAVTPGEVLRDTYIDTQPPVVAQRPRPPPRPNSILLSTQSTRSPSLPASVMSQDAASQVPTPQSDRLGSRPLPAPRPERPAFVPISVQGSVPLTSPLLQGGVETEVSGVFGDAHTTTTPPANTRPRSLSRPASVVRQGITSPVPNSSQAQINDFGSRSPPPPAHLRPEPPASTNTQAQALVPARIGPDGKLEIIPDAEVIWLDEPNARAPEPQIRPGSRALGEGPHSRAPFEMAGLLNSEAEANPFEDSFLGQPATVPTMSRQTSTSSSVYQPLSPGQIQPPVSNPISSASPPTDSSPVASPPARLVDDFEYTDLDLLISRLEENEASRQGANYEQLLAVGEVLGPAGPPPPRPDLDLNVGVIEIQRRRVMKDGRVKLKLSLMGVGVDKCGICLAQFKNNESAVLLPCFHSFHTNCIMSWFVRQDVPACPHCRAPITQ